MYSQVRTVLAGQAPYLGKATCPTFNPAGRVRDPGGPQRTSAKTCVYELTYVVPGTIVPGSSTKLLPLGTERVSGIRLWPLTGRRVTASFSAHCTPRSR